MYVSKSMLLKVKSSRNSNYKKKQIHFDLFYLSQARKIVILGYRVLLGLLNPLEHERNRHKTQMPRNRHKHTHTYLHIGF